MLERRGAKREGMIRRAEIVAGALSIECAALDLSTSGARVYLPDPVFALSDVVLCLPGGSRRAARKRWQDGNDVGFMFVQAAA